MEAFLIDDDSDLVGEAVSDSDPLRCQKPGCTNAVKKPARGRTPKFCEEHKRSGNSSPNKSDRSGKLWPRAAEIESILNDYVTYSAIGVSFCERFDPAFGMDALVIKQQAPNVVHELVELAKDDKDLRKALELLTTPGKYGPLTLSIAGLVIPILANHGLLPKLALRNGADNKGGE